MPGGQCKHLEPPNAPKEMLITHRYVVYGQKPARTNKDDGQELCSGS